MAQQDTGLGWSAESEYLISVSGDFCQVGKMALNITGAENQPIPVTGGSAADVIAGGIPMYLEAGTYRYYIGASSPGSFVAAGQNSGARRKISAICQDQNCTIYVAWLNINTLESSVATRTQFDSVMPGSIRWYAFQVSIGSSMTECYLPITSNPYSNNNREIAYTIAQNVTITADPVTKTENGYAIGCVCRWYTQNGTELLSPILISSETTYVDMTTTATGVNFAKLNYLLSGTRFYMGFWDMRGSMSGSASLVPDVDLTDKGNLTLDQVFMYIVSTSYAHIIIINSPDPYEKQTGSSGEEGGDGDDIVDDDVDFTPLPSSMAVASGFITLFCPSQYELNQLASYMWGPLFDVDTFKKLFANPMDCILGLAVYPFPISASGTKTVSVGGVATTVSMGYTLQQYHIVDCGSVYVPKQWGAYMDYAPYTKFNIFLPYIGFRPVSADDIMGKTISLRYMVDILSGACNAELKCGGTVLYSWAGSCAAQIPITGNDWRSAITSGISIAGSIAATVLTQGASAPMIAGTVASATVNSMQLKPEVQRSGSISSNSGFLAGQRPYLVRTNPRSAIPANQNKYSGYPSFVTISLGSLTGYNEVYSVHLENIPATGAELDEIESILKGGAIF